MRLSREFVGQTLLSGHGEKPRTGFACAPRSPEGCCRAARARTGRGLIHEHGGRYATYVAENGARWRA